MIIIIFSLTLFTGAAAEYDDYVKQVLEEDYRNDSHYKNSYISDADEERLQRNKEEAEERPKQEEVKKLEREREMQFEKELSRMSEDKKKAAIKQKKSDARIVRKVLKAAENENHYSVLGLSGIDLKIPSQSISLGPKLKLKIPGFHLFHATPSKIKKAYRTRSKAVHPDKNRDCRAKEAFVAVENSASILSDERLRKQYDDALHARRLKKQQAVTGKIGRVIGLITRSFKSGFNVVRRILGPFAFPVLILGALVI